LEKNFTPDYYKVYSEFKYDLQDMSEMHKLKEALYSDEDREKLIIEVLIENLK
jgi:hypothetical protein